jgi:hypothetical protein
MPIVFVWNLEVAVLVVPFVFRNQITDAAQIFVPVYC